MNLQDLISSVMRSAQNYHENNIGPTQFQESLHRYYTQRRTTEFWTHMASFASGAIIGALSALAIF